MKYFSAENISQKDSSWNGDHRRVLFMPESASLAHMGRLLTLAQRLPKDTYDIAFACDRTLRSLIPLSFQWQPSSSLSPQVFRDRLDRGQSLLDEELIRKQVNEDLAIFNEFRPAIVVGDFRPSLAISAPLTGIHYINVVNAHWSPWSQLPLRAPGPINTWWCRALGHHLGKAVVDAFLPMGCKFQSLPFNKVRRAYGLDPMPDDIRYIYAAGDTVIYPDLKTLAPTPGAPKSHYHIGPVLWEPEIPFPLWWSSVPTDRPLVFVSVGSTGRWDALERVVRTLRELPVITLVATSGRGTIESVPNKIFVTDYLPGQETCRRSNLVISNGGSGTVYQALSQGVPVLGVAANLDQMSVMAPIEYQGAGRCIPAGLSNSTDWANEISKLISTPQALTKARGIARQIGEFSSSTVFQQIVSGQTNSTNFKSGLTPAPAFPASIQPLGPLEQTLAD